jgi:DNA polymerase III alpha subunit (gram-positive type)
MSIKYIRDNIVNYIATILSFMAIAIRSCNNINVIVTTRNLLWKTYFLQRNELTVTICDNTNHISQSFINLVAITHTYYNKKFDIAVESVAIERFSSSVHSQL